MSTALFKDTVTLYCYLTWSPSVCLRKVVCRVRIIENLKSGGRASASLYIPIYGKRSLKYVPPSEFADKH